MKSRFDFNSVSEITGAFVVLTVVVVVALVVMAARFQRWFDPVYELSVQLPPGVEVPRGASVLIAGSTVGRVAQVALEVPVDDAATGGSAQAAAERLATFVTLELKGDLVQHLHVDSVAQVISPLLPILGEVKITLSKGGSSAPPLFPEGEKRARLATVARAETDLEGNLKVWNEKAIDWEARFVELYEKVDRWDHEMLEWNALLREWEVRLANTYDRIDLMTQGPDGELYLLLTNTNDLVDHLANEGFVGWALRDEEWGGRTEALLAEIEASVGETRETIRLVRGIVAGERPYPPPFDETFAHLPAMAAETESLLTRLDGILEQVEVAARSLPRVATTLEQEAAAVPGFLIESQETLRQVEILVRAIQQHWLLRRYVDPGTAPGRIPVEDIGLPAGAQR